MRRDVRADGRIRRSEWAHSTTLRTRLDGSEMFVIMSGVFVFRYSEYLRLSVLCRSCIAKWLYCDVNLWHGRRRARSNGTLCLRLPLRCR